MECGSGALLPQLTASSAAQPGQCASPDARTSMEDTWLGTAIQPVKAFASVLIPPSFLPPPGAGNLGARQLLPEMVFPYALLEVMAHDLDTYWDFADFLRSTVSEQKDVFVFSCPMQAGLQPQEVLVGGLWLSGRTRLLPAGSGPFSEWLCSFPSLVPASCSS